MKKKLFVIITVSLMLFGCRKADRVSYNIQKEADNFNVRRKVIAINTRTNEALFTVEGYLSISIDDDGDLNVTIQTGEDEYKLFYAHLSDSVTYTCLQIDATETTPYQYEISYFPPKEMLLHGIVDVTEAKEEQHEFDVEVDEGD